MATIISTPVNPTSTSFVVHFANGDISEVMACDILDSGANAPVADPSRSTANGAFDWFVHDANNWDSV